MTKEKIINAGIDYTMSTCSACMRGAAFEDMVRQYYCNPSFEAGAEWAKEELIQEVCEWLDLNLFEVITGINDISIMSYENVSLKEFVESFKKAMDE